MEKRMRCETMLPNHCQCINEATDGNTICKLHLATQKTPGFKVEHSKEQVQNTNQKVK